MVDWAVGGSHGESEARGAIVKTRGGRGDWGRRHVRELEESRLEFC